ncbi:MAG: hypothetical protein J6P72_02060 [Firmicutes bacterium]|nr:hypothetical protein [Bacillota bacterium]
MSMTITLIPLAIAMSMSLTSASLSTLIALQGKPLGDLEPLETRYADEALLLRTLREHGMTVQSAGEGEYLVQTDCGRLHYLRKEKNGPFYLQIENVQNMRGLLESIDSLENEYGRNVQKFTYDRVLHSIRHYGLSIEDQAVLEDESIVLRLRV